MKKKSCEDMFVQLRLKGHADMMRGTIDVEAEIIPGYLAFHASKEEPVTTTSDANQLRNCLIDAGKYEDDDPALDAIDPYMTTYVAIDSIELMTVWMDGEDNLARFVHKSRMKTISEEEANG